MNDTPTIPVNTRSRVMAKWLLILPDTCTLGIIGIHDQTEAHRIQIPIATERQRFPHQIGAPLAKRVVRAIHLAGRSMPFGTRTMPRRRQNLPIDKILVGVKDATLHMRAMHLYGLGYTVSDIHTIAGISRSRLLECLRAYQHGGIVTLCDHRVGGNNAKLTPAQVTDLTDKLHQYTPHSVFGSAAATAGDGCTLPDLRCAVQHW